VPIIPVAITGTAKIFSRRFPWVGFPRVTVTIGEPFLLHTLCADSLSSTSRVRRDDREHMTDEIMRRIAALLPPEMRGYYNHA
jgi:1-acyl-sn-glycerol-3-phosphate acyltransferase